MGYLSRLVRTSGLAVGPAAAPPAAAAPLEPLEVEEERVVRPAPPAPAEPASTDAVHPPRAADSAPDR
ncbi:MAG TPA: hypothetical protein VF541_17285, partial [Longimicrobium sp.]